jgi:hypothetical protein
VYPSRLSLSQRLTVAGIMPEHATLSPQTNQALAINW